MTPSRHFLPLFAATLLLGGALIPLAQAQPPEPRAAQPVTTPTSEPQVPLSEATSAPEATATPTPEATIVTQNASRDLSLTKAVISSDTVAIDINNTSTSSDDQVLLGGTVKCSIHLVSPKGKSRHVILLVRDSKVSGGDGVHLEGSDGANHLALDLPGDGTSKSFTLKGSRVGHSNLSVWLDRVDGNRYTIRGGNGDMKPVEVALLKEKRVKSVSFSGSGFHTIKQDYAGSYNAPHWLDNNGDGSAQNGINGDHNYPVLYECSTAVEAEATFIVSPASDGIKWKVKATTSDSNVKFNAVSATLDGRVLTASVKSSQPLPWKANFYDPLTIDWQISTDDGKSWYVAGSSGCPVYVSFGAPRTSNLFLTVVHAACAGAVGTDYSSRNADKIKAAMLKKIWSSQFEGAIPGLYSHANAPAKDEPMTYWGEQAKQDAKMAQITGTNAKRFFTSAELVRYHDGKCGAWQEIMLDIIGVHNINIPVASEIDADKTVLGGNVVGFRVYERLPGQNNSTPQYDFSNHAVVKSGTIIYDPSYGNKYLPDAGKQNARMKWEDASIAWFVIYDSVTKTFKDQPDKKKVAEVIFLP